jgi:hypothetical protein
LHTALFFISENKSSFDLNRDSGPEFHFEDNGGSRVDFHTIFVHITDVLGPEILMSFIVHPVTNRFVTRVRQLNFLHDFFSQDTAEHDGLSLGDVMRQSLHELYGENDVISGIAVNEIFLSKMGDNPDFIQHLEQFLRIVDIILIRNAVFFHKRQNLL